MINVGEVRQKIISFLQNEGPSIPVKIAKHIKMDPMFASAILSEMTAAHQVKTSAMKIGASQIYFLDGQEQSLERFADEFLKGPEKQAYLSLKSKKYLIDSNQEPAMRVALRSIKDFATPFKHQEQVMWRYNFYPTSELIKLLTPQNEEPKKEISEEKEKEVPEVKEKEEPKEEQMRKPHIEKKEEDIPKPSPKEHSQREHMASKEIVPKKEASSQVSQDKQTLFSDEVREFLRKKNIHLVEEIDSSRNEFIAKISIASALGKTGYFLVARNKKSLNRQDILAAHHIASEQKMPCYILHKGKIPKKTIEKLASYQNLVKIESIVENENH